MNRLPTTGQYPFNVRLTSHSLAEKIPHLHPGIHKERVSESFITNQVEHNFEHVLTIGGVYFINDSTATRVNATWYALSCIDTPIIWIMGGVDKGNDYRILKQLVDEKVKHIIYLGADANESEHKNTVSKRVLKQLSWPKHSMLKTNSMAQAVKAAYQLARKGYTILLSPACASFDLFENYEDRGAQFKAEVRKI